jgi:hypothetical protein
MTRVIRSLGRAFALFRALAFGRYVYSTGGPDLFDEGAVYEIDGVQYKWSKPVPLK